MEIKHIHDFETMIQYFGENLNWDIDTEDFDVQEISYELYLEDLGIKEEELVKISSLFQMRPLTDNMPFGIFAVSFDSKRLEIAALRKILSRLVSKRRNNPNFPSWNCDELIFLCFWGERGDKYIGVACFDDNDKSLPQLKIEYIQPTNEDPSQISNFESKIAHLKMPADLSDTESWRAEWKRTFSATYHQQITDSKRLAHELAELAKHTRDTIISTYNVETGIGYVHLLFKDFQNNLVHDLNVQQFADMYAQTIAYGLFSAKCMDNNEHFDWKDAVDKIPNTNPFLKTLIKSCFKKDSDNAFFDELELSEIVKLLDNTNINNILEHFNRQTGGGREDTVIYFYEDFLSEYEKETKKRRGVYYTPQPVVKFIVRAVDDILRTEFGYKDGLADTSMKQISYLRDSKKKDSRGVYTKVQDTREVPAIQILDPATGTGTFLRETIIRIYDTFVENNKGKSSEEIKKLWNEYVPKQLLPRLNGFELMMAPYAVAHMKLAMVLKDTGYDFESDERLRVVLTNALEPSSSDVSFFETNQQFVLDEDPLAAEAFEANRTKNNNGINVIIGNPPYSGESANKGEWIMSLMEDYKKEPGGVEKLKERNPKWINDDYVKFIRYAQYCVEKSGQGIVAFINPHGFIDNPTFRGMRWKLLSVFDKIYIVDLHGNSNKNETCPDGSKDENVFDIQQGVSILLMIKSKSASELAMVSHVDLFGLRDNKYTILKNSSLSDMILENVSVLSPQYSMVQRDVFAQSNYEKGIFVIDLFQLCSVGIVTANDGVLIGDNELSVISKIKEYYQNADNHLCYPLAYRPFDNRIIYYDVRYIERARYNVAKHILYYNNFNLITARSNKSTDCSHFYISKHISEAKCGERTTQSAMFPLFFYSNENGKTIRTPNLNPEIVKEISEKLGLPFAPDSDGGSTDSFAPIDLLDYIYAVLHSPKYRETYKEFLKIDFPRVPYPTDVDMFWKMVAMGSEIRNIHLMEAPVLDTPITTYPVEGENEVVKPAYKNGKVYINKEQYFDGVSEIAWNFYIGGYQPLQKWLKDRKGRKLSDEDIVHYQKIVVALTETDRLMKEIDEVFVF